MFTVPVDRQSIDQDQFHFEIPDAGQFHVRKAKFLSGRDAIKLTSGDLDTMYSLFGDDGTPMGDAVRDLPVEAFRALVEAWTADSDLTPGESPAS